jgi:hypothetical protein
MMSVIKLIVDTLYSAALQRAKKWYFPAAAGSNAVIFSCPSIKLRFIFIIDGMEL